MRLSCNFVINWASVNQFEYEDQWKMRAGDPVTLYFQLIDLDQENLRYMAGIGLVSPAVAGIIVTCPSIDNSKVLQFSAIQADPNDASVWRITIAPTQVPGSGNVMFQVIEGSAIRNFKKTNGLHVELPDSDGSC